MYCCDMIKVVLMYCIRTIIDVDACGVRADKAAHAQKSDAACALAWFPDTILYKRMLSRMRLYRGRV